MKLWHRFRSKRQQKENKNGLQTRGENGRLVHHRGTLITSKTVCTLRYSIWHNINFKYTNLSAYFILRIMFTLCLLYVSFISIANVQNIFMVNICLLYLQLIIITVSAGRGQEVQGPGRPPPSISLRKFQARGPTSSGFL